MPMNAQQGSYLDMKECLFILEDAHSATGAINKLTGYAKGTTGSLVVDGFTTALDPGLPLKFASHTTVYYITATIETINVTTEVTLDQALTAAVADNEVITVGPHRLEIKIGEGNLTYTESKPREYKLNRGIIDKVRDADQVPMEVQTTFAWTYISSPSGVDIPTVEEFLKRTGPAATYTSTGDACDPFCVNIKVVNDAGVCVGEANPVEITTFPKFYYEQLQHDAKAGTVQTSGKCNAIVATHVRAASWFGQF